MVLEGISLTQTPDGEAGGCEVGGLLSRRRDEPIEVDEGRLNKTWTITNLPLSEFRGIRDLYLSSPPLR
jgi:hypothetical protein